MRGDPRHMCVTRPRCPVCGEPINKHDQVVRHPQRNAWVHWTCRKPRNERNDMHEHSHNITCYQLDLSEVDERCKVPGCGRRATHAIDYESASGLNYYCPKHFNKAAAPLMTEAN